eukprot:CAMPEP_0170732040 /NCGR_PEP_ID=MMETSP0437-20130122/1352_1 /TAXON_ID=0 /ORGANISM="Sexangularia sp." /LENGTH=1192 /DNA_ID=CAMNT_0011070275 /DNA_START=25 /DNA_END=3599 /DNA_ORIENTATION=-
MSFFKTLGRNKRQSVNPAKAAPGTSPPLVSSGGTVAHATTIHLADGDVQVDAPPSPSLATLVSSIATARPDVQPDFLVRVHVADPTVDGDAARFTVTLLSDADVAAAVALGGLGEIWVVSPGASDAHVPKSEWQEFWTPEGERYFHSDATGATSWGPFEAIVGSEDEEDELLDDDDDDDDDLESVDMDEDDDDDFSDWESEDDEGGGIYASVNVIGSSAVADGEYGAAPSQESEYVSLPAVGAAAPLPRLSNTYGAPPGRAAPAVPSAAPTPAPAQPAMPKKSMREMILDEFVDTERAYVADLKLVQSVYIAELRADKKLASPDDIQRIFGNWEQLIMVNEQILAAIDTADGSGKGKIGSTFVALGDFLKMYNAYCASQATALDVVVKLQKERGDFDSFLRYTELRPECRGLNLGAFLVKPMQRVCKYPLLFRELLKHLDKTDGDYASCVTAQAKIEEIVGKINESKREKESSELFVTLQTLEGADQYVIISPSRRLIREGEMALRIGKRKKPRDEKFFLFNDAILFARASGTTLKKVLAFLSFDQVLCKQAGDQVELIDMSDKLSYFIVLPDEAAAAALQAELNESIEAHLSQAYREYVETMDKLTAEAERQAAAEEAEAKERQQRMDKIKAERERAREEAAAKPVPTMPPKAAEAPTAAPVKTPAGGAGDRTSVQSAVPPATQSALVRARMNSFVSTEKKAMSFEDWKKAKAKPLPALPRQQQAATRQPTAAASGTAKPAGAGDRSSVGTPATTATRSSFTPSPGSFVPYAAPRKCTTCYSFLVGGSCLQCAKRKQNKAASAGRTPAVAKRPPAKAKPSPTSSKPGGGGGGAASTGPTDFRQVKLRSTANRAPAPVHSAKTAVAKPDQKTRDAATKKAEEKARKAAEKKRKAEEKKRKKAEEKARKAEEKARKASSGESSRSFFSSSSLSPSATATTSSASPPAAGGTTKRKSGMFAKLGLSKGPEVYCHSCGTGQDEKNSAFCTHCGSPLRAGEGKKGPVACTKCSAKVTSAFCRQCGTKRSPSAKPYSLSQKGGAGGASAAKSSSAPKARANQCNKCMATLTPGKKFCVKCGTPAGGPTPASNSGSNSKSTVTTSSSSSSSSGGGGGGFLSKFTSSSSSSTPAKSTPKPVSKPAPKANTAPAPVARRFGGGVGNAPVASGNTSVTKSDGTVVLNSNKCPKCKKWLVSG